MNMETMLEMLKVDLGISTTAYDARLTSYIQSAKIAIKTEGIDIDESIISDANLIITYAGWLWRKRDTNEGMPRMLRWQLNNRLFGEKG